MDLETFEREIKKASHGAPYKGVTIDVWSNGRLNLNFRYSWGSGTALNLGQLIENAKELHSSVREVAQAFPKFYQELGGIGNVGMSTPELPDTLYGVQFWMRLQSNLSIQVDPKSLELIYESRDLYNRLRKWLLGFGFSIAK